MKTLVLGLGNSVLSDDSVGLHVVRRLRPYLVDRTDVEIDEDCWGGLRLMERMVGYDRVIVVDAIRTGAAPGTIHRLTPDAIPTQRSASGHDMNLSTALKFGREAGVALPATDGILLIGIEAADVHTFCEACTPEIEAAIPEAISTVLAVLECQRNET